MNAVITLCVNMTKTGLRLVVCGVFLTAVSVLAGDSEGNLGQATEPGCSTLTLEPGCLPPVIAVPSSLGVNSTPPASSVGFEDLPVEIQFLIIDHLDLEDVKVLLQTSHSIGRIAAAHPIWKIKARALYLQMHKGGPDSYLNRMVQELPDSTVGSFVDQLGIPMFDQSPRDVMLRLVKMGVLVDEEQATAEFDELQADSGRLWSWQELFVLLNKLNFSSEQLTKYDQLDPLNSLLGNAGRLRLGSRGGRDLGGKISWKIRKMSYTVVGNGLVAAALLTAVPCSLLAYCTWKLTAPIERFLPAPLAFHKRLAPFAVPWVIGSGGGEVLRIRDVKALEQESKHTRKQNRLIRESFVLKFREQFGAAPQLRVLNLLFPEAY